MRITFICISAFVFFLSCERGAKLPESPQIARVGKIYLHEDELKELMPPNLSRNDSIRVREATIQEWVKEQLILEKARQVLSDAEKNKDKQLKSYYNSLLRYDYERKLVLERLDTSINEEEISEYYLSNQKNFELKRNIIRLLYVKLPLDVEKPEKARGWIIRPEDQEAMDSLQSFADAYAVNYTLDKNIWFYFSDINKEVPITENYNPGHFIRNNKYVELKDDQYLYLINILDKRIKDDTAPLQMERQNIINILRNQRKVKLLKEIEKEALEEGLKKNTYEIY